MQLKLDAAEVRACTKLALALDRLIEVNPAMSLQAAKVFLLIAALPESDASNSTIAARLDMPQASVSRTLGALSDRVPKDGGTGQLGLLRIVEDTADYRRKLWLLTPKGKAAITKISEALA